ncbi:SPOR domain-containing protein [Roseicitreum antarcticum]|uniref:Sporulation related domain-containing protein n=1 Tax=Roseicitreum antarcticum TaxID=564137 RepID=A0A1H2RCF0_9RHOB|nr:SPOR domain-containing protein [Roseicitreum antarcticum]SDW16339.1 Sporulation related domain-containing protein [Roseicitreum antarcticum]
MRFNGIAAVLLVTFGVTGPALAQNGALVPAEMPPADYSGNQYSDSRGCLFIRASFDGRVTWVPRFDGNRQPICTTPASAPASAPAPAPAPAPVPASPPPATTTTASTTAGTLARSPAIAPQRISQTVSVPQPATPPRRASSPRQTSRPSLPAGHNAACPASSPFGELVRRASGEVAVRCVTSANLMLNPPAGATTMPYLPPVALTNTAVQPRPAPLPIAPLPIAPPPIAPLPTVAPQPVMLQPVTLQPVALTTPPAPRAAPYIGTFVQVATFGVPQNAARTHAALQARGLPARLQPTHAHGQRMQVVLAGPFFDTNTARNAVQTARGMGFADAFIRR